MFGTVFSPGGIGFRRDPDVVLGWGVERRMQNQEALGEQRPQDLDV